MLCFQEKEGERNLVMGTRHFTDKFYSNNLTKTKSTYEAFNLGTLKERAQIKPWAVKANFLLSHFCAKRINCTQLAQKWRLAESDLQHSLCYHPEVQKTHSSHGSGWAGKSTLPCLITEEILLQSRVLFISSLIHG